jgi:ABC-type multidrug transport system fused ATPase/permease subunit
MESIIFKKLVSDFMVKNKSLMSLYLAVIIFTWPAEAIVLSRQYSNLVTSLKQKVNITNLFDISKNLREENVFGILWLIILIWVFLIIFYRIKYHLEQKFFPIYMSHIRNTLVSSILESNSSNYKDIKSGEYISIINELTHVFLSMVEKITSKFLPLLIGIILIGIYYVYINVYVGGTFLILSILRFIINYCQGMEYAKSCALRDKSYFDLNEHINDTFNNSLNIHLNNTLKYEEKKGRKINDKYDLEQEEEMKVRKDMIWKSNLLSVICFVVIIILSYNLYVKKKLSLPLLLTIAFIEIKLIGTFIEFDSTSLQFFQRFGTILATSKFLNQIFTKSKEGSKSCLLKNSSIDISNMYFRYNKNSPYVFKNMNLSVKSGERIGLIGRSGSGKTSLMKILLGLNKVSSGSIKIGGCEVNKINTDKLRNSVIYINQRTNLFNDSILKNIQYGNENLSEGDVLSYMKKYNLDIIYSGMNKGIHSKTGVNGSLLSLGMQKITMILRGIFKEGDIIIFDEPLSGLDSKTKSKVINIINGISKSKTVIVVTHDNEILEYLDNVYDLNELHQK